MATLADNVQRVVDFIGDIGIPVEQDRVSRNSFLPHIEIAAGTIVFNSKVAIADLLHEAGHLATIPTKYRSLCDFDVGRSTRHILNDVMTGEEKDPLHPMMRAMLQTGDCEATAWAWAAGKHLNVPERSIIVHGKASHYDGNGATIALMLRNSAYFGVNGLRAAGFLQHTRDFPRLTKWLQDC